MALLERSQIGAPSAGAPFDWTTTRRQSSARLVYVGSAASCAGLSTTCADGVGQVTASGNGSLGDAGALEALNRQDARSARSLFVNFLRLGSAERAVAGAAAGFVRASMRSIA